MNHITTYILDFCHKFVCKCLHFAWHLLYRIHQHSITRILLSHTHDYD